MKITILAVGRLKEPFYRDAAAEYKKRLGRYASIEILEAADEKIPDRCAPQEALRIKEKEGERLEKRIPHDAYVIALAIEGQMLDSLELAKKLDTLCVHGASHIVFVIGGSLGLSEKLLRRADMRLSFSKMTFPHQLMRIILLEQVYRSFRINSHEPYHK